MFRSQANEHDQRRSVPLLGHSLPITLHLGRQFRWIESDHLLYLGRILGSKRGNRYAMIHGDMVEDRCWCSSCVGTGSTWEAVTGLERAVRMTTAPELKRSAQTGTVTLTQPEIPTSQGLLYLYIFLQ